MSIELVNPLPTGDENYPKRRSGVMTIDHFPFEGDDQIYDIYFGGSHQSSQYVDRDTLERIRDRINELLSENPKCS